MPSLATLDPHMAMVKMVARSRAGGGAERVEGKGGGGLGGWVGVWDGVVLVGERCARDPGIWRVSSSSSSRVRKM